MDGRQENLETCFLSMGTHDLVDCPRVNVDEGVGNIMGFIRYQVPSVWYQH